jgi:hypothetical protein
VVARVTAATTNKRFRRADTMPAKKKGARKGSKRGSKRTTKRRSSKR